MKLTNVKNLIGTTLVAGLLFMGASTLTSCGKDGCTDSTATNYDADADSDDGSCTYDRDQFIGTYNATESCSSGNGTYNMTITEGSQNTVTINIGNFGNFNVSAVATVSGNNITIAAQNFTVNGNAITISGAGSMSGSTLTINYTTVFGGTTDVCTVTALKQ